MFKKIKIYYSKNPLKSRFFNFYIIEKKYIQKNNNKICQLLTELEELVYVVT